MYSVPEVVEMGSGIFGLTLSAITKRDWNRNWTGMRMGRDSAFHRNYICKGLIGIEPPVAHSPPLYRLTLLRVEIHYRSPCVA